MISDLIPTHPRDAEAAEYALGTLAAGEQVAFRQAMVDDPGLAAAVRAWEERLVPLAGGISPVAPSGHVWGSITSRTAADKVVAFPSEQVERLRRAKGWWRGAAITAGAIAAMLAVALVVDRGERQPVPALMAVVNRSGDLPALIVRVDQRAGVIQIRALAAETPEDHSLELWSIAKGEAPRPLGILAGDAARLNLPATQAWPAEGATIAVSVEPKGGSPTGAPTGPVVYSGRLVQDLP